MTWCLIKRKPGICTSARIWVHHFTKQVFTRVPAVGSVRENVLTTFMTKSVSSGTGLSTSWEAMRQQQTATHVTSVYNHVKHSVLTHGREHCLEFSRQLEEKWGYWGHKDGNSCCSGFKQLTQQRNKQLKLRSSPTETRRDREKKGEVSRHKHASVK